MQNEILCYIVEDKKNIQDRGGLQSVKAIAGSKNNNFDEDSKSDRNGGGLQRNLIKYRSKERAIV